MIVVIVLINLVDQNKNIYKYCLLLVSAASKWSISGVGNSIEQWIIYPDKSNGHYKLPQLNNNKLEWAPNKSQYPLSELFSCPLYGALGKLIKQGIKWTYTW